MTSKTMKTILFASLIAAMILPFNGINFAQAQVAEQTDEQLITQYDKMFGDPKELATEKVYSDVRIDEYAIISEVPDHVKISVMKSIESAKDKSPEEIQYEQDFLAEQATVQKPANALVELINNTEDSKAKAVLQDALDDMKNRMAEVGLFVLEDKDNEELNDKFFRTQEGKQDAFNTSKMPVSFNSENSSELILASHNPYTYRVDTTVKYVCGLIVCSVNPQIDYKYQSQSVTHSGAIGSSVGFGSWGEWYHKLTNLQHISIFQGTYHQGIHYDPSWNYKDGDTSYANFLYVAGGNHDINHFTTSSSVSAGDQTYSYLYIGP